MVRSNEYVPQRGDAVGHKQTLSISGLESNIQLDILSSIAHIKCALQGGNMKATILDLRRRMKDVLLALDRNESVTIYYRGKGNPVTQPSEDGNIGNRPFSFRDVARQERYGGCGYSRPQSENRPPGSQFEHRIVDREFPGTRRLPALLAG